ncbi:MAG TPA: hypothetical protein VF641_03395 [Methylobacterium sp.]|jgi:hypothetical protein
MPGSKREGSHLSAETIGETDFAKADAHVVQPEEYEELPELTDEMMNRAVRKAGGELTPESKDLGGIARGANAGGYRNRADRT